MIILHIGEDTVIAFLLTFMYTYPINVQLTAITVTTAGITIIMSVTYNYITTETRSHAVSSPLI